MSEKLRREARLAGTTTGVIVTMSVLLTVLTHLGAAPGWRWLLGVAAALLASLAFLVVRHRVLAGGPTLASWWGCVVAGIVGLWALCVASEWASLGLVMAGVALGAPSARTAGVVLLGLITAIVALPLTVGQDAVATTVMIVLISALVALVLYALTRLIALAQDLRRSQAEVARLEVEQERARISRDLHDVIGRTMVAASLRNQTALALIGRDPSTAAEQIQATHDVLTKGQARLREITSGPMLAGLPEELDAAADLCEQLGIVLDLEADLAADALADPAASRVAAQVVRESVTNMLRHSRPRRCTLIVTSGAHGATITVDNDGCPAAPTRTAGTGLRDLERRLTALGGSLETHRRRDRFILTCHIPTPERP